MLYATARCCTPFIERPAALAQRLKSNMIPRNPLLTIRTDGGPYKKRIILFKRMQPCMIRPLFIYRRLQTQKRICVILSLLSIHSDT